jgi:hypothetical protein
VESDVATDTFLTAVEIKVVARESDEEVVRSALDLVDVDPEHRDLYFFDTASLELFGQGLVLRARKIRDGVDDSTVKLRPFPAGEENRWTDLKDLEIELDVVGDEPVRSAKLGNEQRPGEIDAVSERRLPIKRLFSDEQEALVRFYRRKRVSWGDLRPIGPIKVHKWKVRPESSSGEVTVEEWILSGTEDLVELSVKVDPHGWEEASAVFQSLLSDRKIRFAGSQEAKTLSALRYLLDSSPS